MKEVKIIKYTEDWECALRDYMKKRFPTYSEEYISYCVGHAKDREPALLVINEDGIIVGCQQFYCTHAVYKGQSIDVQWGHDTFLDKEYRSVIGLDFVLAIKSVGNIFGIGLTDVNKKIYKLQKAVFFEGVYNYYIFTPFVIIDLFFRVFHLKKKNTKWIEVIRYKDCSFKKVTSAKEITIPNNGFWFDGYNDLDFIRDTNFLDKRFFNNEVYKYAVYSSGSAYFVVRKTIYRGFPALLVCDFRYNPSDNRSVNFLMKSVAKVAEKTHSGLILFMCGDKSINHYFKHRIHYKRPTNFVSLLKIPHNSSFTITGGDADAELLI